MTLPAVTQESLSIQQSPQDQPCPYSPEMVPAPLWVAQGAALSLWFSLHLPTLLKLPYLSLPPLSCRTLADTLTTEWTQAFQWVLDNAPWHLSSTLSPSLSSPKGSFQSGRQRAAIIRWKWKFKVLAIPFFSVLPDLHTLNGHKMFPGNKNLDKSVFVVKIWDFKKPFSRLSSYARSVLINLSFPLPTLSPLPGPSKAEFPAPTE